MAESPSPVPPDRAPRYREVEAKSITRLRGIVDPWFLARYGMNLYRGCEHGCLYCDGRAERYYIPGDFARDITVKPNAVAVLSRELLRAKEPGFVFLGGGVCDGYQQADEQYQLARGVLEIALQRRLPVHVLTKSRLVERDLDLLARINEQSRAILSFSLQTADEAIRGRFEPGAAAVVERLRLMAQAKEAGLGVGVMAMPVLPGISDQPEAIDQLVGQVAEHGADFVCFGALTLRPGKQKDTYLAVIREHYPDLLPGYLRVYRSQHSSGAPDPRYSARVHDRFAAALQRHDLPGRAPRRLFTGQLPRYAEVAVLLEHREATGQLTGQAEPGLGRAGMAIQVWARDNISKRGRRKSFRYTLLEDEFAAMLADGSLTKLPGVTSEALAAARAIAAV